MEACTVTVIVPNRTRNANRTRYLIIFTLLGRLADFLPFAAEG